MIRIRSAFAVGMATMIACWCFSTVVLAQGANVTLRCFSDEVGPGNNFEVEVLIDSRSQVLGAYTVTVVHDPAVLSLLGVTAGETEEFSLLPTTNPADFPTGRTRISAFNTGLASPTGISSVAKVDFSVLSTDSESASIDVEIVTLADIDGTRIGEVSTDACAVSFVDGTPRPTVTEGVASPTPTLAPTPSTTSAPLSTATPTVTPTHTTGIPTRPIEPCPGDCNGDGAVKPDELVLGVNVALKKAPLDHCLPLDGIADGEVSVDELVTAVDMAVHGCPDAARTESPTPTFTATRFVPSPTPTRSVDVTAPGVDLRPFNLFPNRCLSEQCSSADPFSWNVCVGNSGEENAGPFVVEVAGAALLELDGLPSGVLRCFPFGDLVEPGTVVVDVGDRVAESNEENNERVFPTLVPTACDAIPPPCTPTPPVPAVHSCDQCCDDCTTEACFLACFGKEACQLVTQWEGVITDALTDDPISGAVVTVNGKTVTTDAGGFYATTSVKEEVCNGLDYLYEINVQASGYRTFLARMYQSLVAGVRRRNIALEPAP